MAATYINAFIKVNRGDDNLMVQSYFKNGGSRREKISMKAIMRIFLIILALNAYVLLECKNVFAILQNIVGGNTQIGVFETAYKFGVSIDRDGRAEDYSDYKICLNSGSMVPVTYTNSLNL